VLRILGADRELWIYGDEWRTRVFDDRHPIYRQIAERIRAEVLSGGLGEEQQVMSTTQYATHFRINPATAAKAFAELVDEGVLYKRRGVGMFVAPGARQRLLEEHRSRFFAEVVDPVVDEAQAIGIPLDAVLSRMRERAASLGASDGRDGSGDEQVVGR
jgi:GntR family transcriptional regulator